MTILSTTDPWYAVGDPWVLTQTQWEPEKNIYYETIFTQSNGYMGVRGYLEEKDATVEAYREGYLAGVFGHIDKAAMKQVDVDYPWPMLCMMTLPELFACEIELNGERFLISEGSVEFFTRSLDMRNGVLTRKMVWKSPKGHLTRLSFQRFLSAAVPHLAMQHIEVTPENWSGSASLKFALDGEYPTYFRCGDRSYPHLRQDLLEKAVVSATDGIPHLDVTVRGTGHRVTLASALWGEGTSVQPDGTTLTQCADWHLAQGESAEVVHAVGVASSRDTAKPAEVAQLAADVVREGLTLGYEGALNESEAVWSMRWERSEVAIDGPARDQAYLRYSSFSMLQMAPFHTDNMSVPARAYAFNRYHGLYYWDSETFLMPHYLYTHPEVAENLLSFRYRTLEGARRTARHLKSTGAFFPWMTDSDDGTEQGPWGIGDYLWHQNADIAYAIDQYVRSTGDTAFMVEKGWEMIAESARFWMSRMEKDGKGVMHLHDTVGPDELDKHGKDNGYASLMARRHLRLAVAWQETLKESHPSEISALLEKLELGSSEIESWKVAADSLAVPNVPGTDFPLQDEFLLAKKPLSFEGMTADEAFAKRHTHRVVKQADIVVAMFLLQDEFSVEQMEAAYDFYEPMCLHFSSLSYNTHSIMAVKIGRYEQAYDYFMKAAGLDLDNLRNATKDGLHAAALGGTWQTVVYGFLGMRLEGDTLLLDPRIPEAWKSISLTLVHHGFELRLQLSHDRHLIEVSGAEGKTNARIVVDGEPHTLRDGMRIETGMAVAS
jgi:trehalose/maltose hydrolase-like predicted phosphorylase